MNYFSRVIRTFIVLSLIGLAVVLLFYFTMYHTGFEKNTLISIITIVLILSFSIPLMSDNYKKQSLIRDSLHPEWKSIIQKETESTHRMLERREDLIVLQKRENPLLAWFFLGRRNTWIRLFDKDIVFYGPGELTQKLSAKIFY